MNILITAGGTIENIDQVRYISNHSTGAMGCAVADAFLRFSQTAEITYVCGLSALCPQESDRVKTVRISNVQSLQDTLTQILSSTRLDGIVHSMAVSDYAVDAVTSSAHIKQALLEGLSHIDGDAPESGPRISAMLEQCLHHGDTIPTGGKISSDLDDLIVVMKKTPKIIGMFKAMQPRAVLVGFKLLNGVSPDTLMEAGRTLMKRNACDFVFANDLAELSPGHHCGYLLSTDGAFEKLEGREAIADKIAFDVVSKIM